MVRYRAMPQKLTLCTLLKDVMNLEMVHEHYSGDLSEIETAIQNVIKVEDAMSAQSLDKVIKCVDACVDMIKQLLSRYD